MKKNNKYGFTLVELLAVIVILAIILVIAVPTIMNTIDNSREGALMSSAKLIAASAETKKMTNDTLEISETITCDMVADINSSDYESCTISFDDDGNASVSIKGKGKFEGKYVCSATRSDATVTYESCSLVALSVNLDGGSDNVDYEEKYEAGSKVTLEEPTKEGYAFNRWTVTGNGSSVSGNELTMGSEATVVTATWIISEYTANSFNTLLAQESTLNNGLVQTTATYNEIEYDAGIRYTGESPNNYIYYNCEAKDSNDVSYGSLDYDYASSCETWRIIGVFDAKTSTNGSSEKRIKIINTASTFTASWDSSDSTINEGKGINEWSQADLQNMLNTYYIGTEGSTCTYCNGSGQATCTNTCDTADSTLASKNMKPLTSIALTQVDNAVWDTYAVGYGDYELDSSYASSAYLQEKGIRGMDLGNTYCSTHIFPEYCNDSVTRTASWTGLVGLMYASDIGYANGWLHNGMSITVANQSYGDATFVFVTGSEIGNVTIMRSAGSGLRNIYPSLYLKSNIRLTGLGTSDSPFIIEAK